MTKVVDPPGLERLELETARRLVRWIPALVHRLNNSLAVIHAAAEDPAAREQAEREFGRARGLLRQLALLARTPAFREEDLDLAALVEGIAELARPSFEVASVPLTLERPRGAIPVRADPSRLGSLLAILVDGLLGAPLAAGDAGAYGRARLALALEGAHAVLVLAREDPPRAERPESPQEPPRDAADWARALGGTLEVLREPRGRACRLVLSCPLGGPLGPH